MSSSQVKAKLKAAREAIGNKEWPKAEKAAREAIELDGGNYNAHVFLALALSSAAPPKSTEAEATYKKAVDLGPKSPLAWQGLATLYEKEGKWEECAGVEGRLAEVFAEAGDTIKVGETVWKLIALRRQHGTRADLMNALSLLLPSSPFAPLLSTLPPPDPTSPTAPNHALLLALQNTLPLIHELLSLAQTDETAYVEKEVAARRTRLSAAKLSAAEQREEVVREVYSRSRLPGLWREVINHPSASDVERHAAESAMLLHAKTLLEALPSPFPAEVADFSTAGAAGQVEDGKSREKWGREKDALRRDVEEMARGLVVVGVPDEVAWGIVLDWGEVTGEVDNARGYLGGLEDAMPGSELVRMLRLVRRLSHPEETEHEADWPKKSKKPPEEDDPLTALETCFSSIQSRSILAHHLLIHAYVLSHESALLIPVAESGLSLLSALEPSIGKRLLHSRRRLQTPLATALVQWEAPKHHLRATRIVDALLEDEEGSKDAEVMMAKAALEAGRERWKEAEAWYGRALRAKNVGEERSVEARAESAWCRAMQGRYSEGAEELEGVIESLEAEAAEAQTDRSATRLAKAYYRLGRCRWLAPEGDGRDTKAAYSAFIRSIKWKTTFAPAFTSLGTYYLEAISPPDYSRASKCFQKAFELDPTEDLAVRKLAEEFAEDREWDLVEVVARRVLDGTGGTSALGGPLAQKLSWAWLALGSAELVKKRYLPAVAAFQSAVRGAPSDPHAWLKLGLAYRGAGKHVAALKTFAKATELAPDMWWARFCVGDVQRALGLLDPAIAAFEAILEERPDEVGVRVVLAETRYSRAVEYLKNGYISRAETSFVQALEATKSIVEAGTGVRIAWKIVGDVFTELGRLRTLDVTEDLRSLFSFFVNAVAQANADGKMQSIDAVTTLEVSAIVAEFEGAALFVAAAVLAYKMRVLLELRNDASVGPAWLDLGLALSRLKATKGSFKLMAGEDAARRQSIQAARFALQHEPSNAAFWNVLGVLSFELSPRLAQHAFIKSVEHNERSPVAWSNLGFFYVAHGDHELANQSFLRAQVSDPDWSLAWIGQALLAAVNGDATESAVLVEHAFTLSAGSNRDADLAFATTAFDRFRTSSSDATTTLSPAFFAVSRILSREVSATVLHLHALLAERLGDLEDASSSLERAAEILEAQYEEDESSETETKYATAFANLGRIRLALGSYSSAIEAFDTVLSLRATPSEDTLRLQALLGSGIAKYFADDLDGSLSALQTLMEEASSDSSHRTRAVASLAKVLWALGGEEQRQEARQVLLDAFGSGESTDMSIVAMLAAIGVVEDDGELLDAAVTEIVNAPRDQRKQRDPDGLIDDLLVSQHLAKGQTREIVTLLSSAAHANPSSAVTHADLARQLLRSGFADAVPPAQREAATALTLVGSDIGAGRRLSKVDAVVLDAAARLGDHLEDSQGVQEAVWLAPARPDPWRVLLASKLQSTE